MGPFTLEQPLGDGDLDQWFLTGEILLPKGKSGKV